MKKAFFIYTFSLSVSCLAGLSLAAQQQKKPSERSFAEEVNRFRQMESLQRSRSQKQQSANGLATNTQPGDQTGSNPTANPANNTQTVKPQQPALKPSQRPIELPKKKVSHE